MQVEMLVHGLLGHLQPQLLRDEGARDLRPQLLPCIILAAEAILNVAVQPAWMPGGVAALMQKG